MIISKKKLNKMAEEMAAEKISIERKRNAEAEEIDRIWKAIESLRNCQSRNEMLFNDIAVAVKKAHDVKLNEIHVPCRF